MKKNILGMFYSPFRDTPPVSVSKVDCFFLTVVSFANRWITRGSPHEPHFFSDSSTSTSKFQESIGNVQRAGTSPHVSSERRSIDQSVSSCKQISPNELAKYFRSSDWMVLHEKLILDVRTLREIKYDKLYGEIILGAVVVPFHELYEGFQLSPRIFEQKYGFAIPKTNAELIVYCTYGLQRSPMASDILELIGYSNVSVLEGGIKNWKKNYPEYIKSI